MDMTELLVPQAVRSLGQVTSKKRLFQTLSDIACDSYEMCDEGAARALIDREALGSTAVGNGIALPHAHLAGIDKVIGLFVKLETPLDFDATDRKPVDLIFCLFAPEQAGVEHLKALALVSRRLREASLCAKLRANSDPQLLFAILTETETTKAA